MKLPIHAYREHRKGLSVGDHAADLLRNGMGSWLFVFFVLGAICSWLLTSGLGSDPRPFSVLNLVLSCFAVLQGVIILISARRQDQLSAALSEAIYQNAKDANSATKRLDENITLLLAALHLDIDKEQLYKLSKITP